MLFTDDTAQPTGYIRYQVMHPVGQGMFDISRFDLPDIRDNEVLLRVNKNQNVIYTVRKTYGKFGPEYIFRSYMIEMQGNNSIASLALFSQCSIEKLPNMLFLRENIKTGVTTLDEVKERIPDTKFNLRGDEGSSAYACADKYGTIVYVHYKKDTSGIFRVENVRWTCSGYNVLPYLLPIDRQLIDPNYTSPEEIEDFEEVSNSCCNVM